MTVKSISRSVSLIYRDRWAMVKIEFLFCTSVFGLVAHFLYPFLLVSANVGDHTSTLAWIMWEFPSWSSAIFFLAALKLTHSFEYDDLFCNQRQLSHDGSQFVKTRTSQHLKLEDRQYWLIVAVSCLASFTLSVDIIKVWMDILKYVEVNVDVINENWETDTQAYVAILWTHAMILVGVVALLVLVWKPFFHLKSFTRRAGGDEQTELPVVPAEEPRTTVSKEDLTREEEAIDVVWDNIVDLLDGTRTTAYGVFTD